MREIKTFATCAEEYEFKTEREQDKDINAFDSKNPIKAERLLNRNTKDLTFAFVVPKNFDKISDIERENIFRKIDNLPLLEERVEVKSEKRQRAERKENQRRYI